MSHSEIQRISLADIDQVDKRFQHSRRVESSDLSASVAEHGQQVPITLWGAVRPYKIIDGFRRVEALRACGEQEVDAIVRDDLDENAAAVLSFVENEPHRGYTLLDKAGAIRRAIHQRGASPAAVAEAFGLSERQLQRYLRLLDLSPELTEALVANRISMGHAIVLDRHDLSNVDEWVRRIFDQRLSVGELRSQLGKRQHGRPRSYIVKDNDGFRVTPFRYHPALPERERRRILEAIEAAAEIVRADCREASDEPDQSSE